MLPFTLDRFWGRGIDVPTFWLRLYEIGLGRFWNGVRDMQAIPPEP